jgi:hypothetical protein
MKISKQLLVLEDLLQESSAYLLNRLSKENRKKVLDAYFSEKKVQVLTN